MPPQDLLLLHQGSHNDFIDSNWIDVKDDAEKDHRTSHFIFALNLTPFLINNNQEVQ